MSDVTAAKILLCPFCGRPAVLTAKQQELRRTVADLYVERDAARQALAEAQAKFKAERSALIRTETDRQDWRNRAENSEAALEEAVEALRPFARLATFYSDDTADDCFAEEIVPYVEDLRRARAALSRLQESADPSPDTETGQ